MRAQTRVRTAGGSGRARGRLSPARLARLSNVLAGHVERGQVPGLVALVSRRGDVHAEVHGTLEAGGAEPVRRDTIFRVASLTKPVAAVAALILVEEARLRLDEPVDRWLPELADRRVLRTLESPLDDTVRAERPITVRDLLTFRLGIGLVAAPPGRYPIQAAMAELGLAPGPTPPAFPPDEVMRRFGTLPLLHQPGREWHYNSGSDILGVLISRVTGRSLGDFLAERVFGPLGMRDTGFSVPESKLHRLATAYAPGPDDGALTVFDEARGGRYSSPPAFESGAGGLASTADDYLAFGLMLLNGGVHGGERILSRPSVETMTTDQLTPEQKDASPFFPGFWRSHGWGLGVSVVTHRADVWTVPGQFGWDGGTGTSWRSDPKEELAGVLMTQRQWSGGGPPRVHHDFWASAYQAIDD